MPEKGQPEQQCVVCKTDHTKVPLITLTYQSSTFYICPQHLPVLIHNPQQLIGVLPGAENLESGHHDH